MTSDALTTGDAANREPIALVGAGCRFPGGADDPASFWELLLRGDDAITEIPPERWDLHRFYDPDPDKPGKMYIRAGGFLKQRIDQCDALFFGISPREAACMDPQQRILLEVAWEALEDAGLDPQRLAGSDTGVYVGAFTLDNKLTQMGSVNRELIGSHTAISSTMTILSNRLSYVLDLRGPSISMDTACSSSLVAVHQACQAIWQGDCSLALAGGVNIILRPEYTIAMCKGQFLSPDGRCKSFDGRADGYGRGEGAGIVVLKPLAAALRDGDDVYAVIRGTGVNQDGRTDGITVPNPQSQADLIRRVCAQAGVEPKRIRYFEAHGTGTPVGDPIEASALGAAVGADRAPEDACLLGSVKANIGHLEAASGVAGLIKAALCLRHQRIPPLANLETPNPNIHFAELGLRLPGGAEPMPAGVGPACVGINSFGYGGTNAHAILEEAPRPQQQLGHLLEQAVGHPYVLPLSARSEQALSDLARAYRNVLRAADAPSLHNLCYSAGTRRGHHDHRLAVVAQSREEMAEQLESWLEHGRAGRASQGRAAGGETPRPVFVFTGMGPQWWAMGRELLRSEPVFRTTAQACDDVFRALAGWSIVDEMNADEDRSRITETQIAQPANFVVQAGLAALWRSRGIEPAAVIGHSVGEVAAAYVAGALDLEDAVRVSYQRSRIQKKAAGAGTMLAVGLAEDQAQALLGGYAGRVSLAAANGPTTLTLSGDAGSLEEIAALLEAKGVFNRFLQVEVAYHSPYMDPLLDEVRASLKDLRARAPNLPLYSTVTGERVETAGWDAEYWCRNIREPVLFARAVERLAGEGHRLFLEVGPHPVLSASINECLLHRGVRGHVVASLRREQPELGTLAEALGALYTAGVAVDWRRLYPAGGRYVKLPAYPWQRDTYWRESVEALADRLGNPGTHPLLNQRIGAPEPCWESQLNEQTLPYLGDHRVDGVVVFPGAGYVEAGLALHHHLDGEASCALEDLRFHQALVVEAGDEPVLRLQVDENTREYTVFSRTRDDRTRWTLHAGGRLSAARPVPAAAVDLEAIRRACPEAVDAATHYHLMDRRGLQYGPRFQGIRGLWRGEDSVLAQIERHEALGVGGPAYLHPTLLDACFQSLIAILDGDGGSGGLYLPVSIRQIRFHAAPQDRLWSHGRLRQRAPEAIGGDIVLCDDHGRVLVEVCGLQCQAVAQQRSGAVEHLDRWVYGYRWEAGEPAEITGDGGRWLVFADREGFGERLVQALDEAGADTTLVRPGSAFRREGAGRYRLRPGSPDDLHRLLASAGEHRGVAYLWGLDAPTRAADPTAIADTLAALHLVQALGRQGGGGSPRLYLVTRGVQQAGGDEGVSALGQAPLVGLGRVALNEHPDLRCTLVDIDPRTAGVSGLARELLADRPEDDVALRGGERYVHRLARTPLDALQQAAAPEVAAVTGVPSELILGRPADPDSLHLRASRRRAPGPAEVEIRLHAVALEGADRERVLAPSRQRQADGARLHGEHRPAAGVVTRVGSAVQGLQAGDAVIARLPCGVSTHATVPADALLAVPKPENVDFAAAAAAALAAVPVLYGLHHAARLQAGETVLVAGEGAEIAAEMARRHGARVLAGAEGAEREAALRAQGIEDVVDIDALDFVDRVLALSEGRGVDVILSQRAPSAQSCRVLAPFGRYVRLGRGGAGERTPLTALERNLSISAVDIDGMVAHRPEWFRRALGEVGERMRSGALSPPVVPVFPVLRAAEAVQCLAQGGAPVVLTLEDAESIPVLPALEETAAIHPSGSYLITGGFGGFGLKLAEWLAAQGARHLVLVGRSGAATAEARQAVAALEAGGVRVLAAAADITREADVVRLLHEITGAMPPLTGVLHAAAVLDDAPLADLDDRRFERVMAPKTLGAWHLHRHTTGLDFFVLFSSVSCLIGNARQGNYVAGNAYLDALAHHRRARGLPATSINWGALAGVGMAARSEDVERHLEMMGIRTFSAEQAMAVLARVLEWNPVQIGVMDVDWQQWARFEPTGGASPRFAQLVAEGGAHAGGAATGVREQLQALSPEERREMLTLMLAEQVAETLRLPAERVNVDQPLAQMGVDSLMAVELQTGISLRFGVQVSTLELMKGHSIARMAEPLLDKLGISGEASTGAPSAVDADRIDALSEADVDSLLNELLESEEA